MHSNKVLEKQQHSIVPLSWTQRVFRALDSEGRGYLIRDENLDHIEASGTRFHGQIESLVQTLENSRRHYNDPIYFLEFE